MTSCWRPLLFVLPILLFGQCSTKETQKGETSNPESTAVNLATEYGITGDFDGDKQPEKILTKLMSGPGAQPEEPWTYAIEFLNAKLPPLEIEAMSEDGFYLLNEGDIDGLPGEELSVVTSAMDHLASLSVYGFREGQWIEIAESINVVAMLPDDIDKEDLLTDTDSGVFALQFEVVRYDSLPYSRIEVSIADAFGDFDGDGEIETAYVEVDEANFHECTIVFSNKKLPSIALGNLAGSEAHLTNDGNKDGKPGDELVIDYALMMGKKASLQYAFDGRNWKEL
jgi:hypothetical protein